MRLYVDLSCFNRPFDDQGQERIRLETEAVFVVLTRIMEGKDTLLWSWVMSFENDKHPNPDRRDEIAVWEARAERSISLSNKLEERARQISELGIAGLDAVHLASAEEGGRSRRPVDLRRCFGASVPAPHFGFTGAQSRGIL